MRRRPAPPVELAPEAQDEGETDDRGVPGVEDVIEEEAWAPGLEPEPRAKQREASEEACRERPREALYDCDFFCGRLATSEPRRTQLGAVSATHARPRAARMPAVWRAASQWRG